MNENYVGTFITVAPDCPVDTAVVPELWRGKETVATIQFAMLDEAPYTLTQQDVLFLTLLRQRGIDPNYLADGGEAMRAEHFSVGRACLRASPLPKKYGWGIHFDAQGGAALHAVDSPRYAELSRGGDGDPVVLPAMRSSRG